MTHYHHTIPWEVIDQLEREEIGANMARRAQNGGSRCRRCFQTPCIREIRHSLTHIPTLPSLCDPTLGVRRRRSSGKLPVIEDCVFGSRDLSQSFFHGHIVTTTFSLVPEVAQEVAIRKQESLVSLNEKRLEQDICRIVGLQNQAGALVGSLINYILVNSGALT